MGAGAGLGGDSKERIAQIGEGVDAVTFGALDKRKVAARVFHRCCLVSNPINVPVVLEKRRVMRLCYFDAVPHPSRNLEDGHALLYQHAAE